MHPHTPTYRTIAPPRTTAPLPPGTHHENIEDISQDPTQTDRWHYDVQQIELSHLNPPLFSGFDELS